MTEPVARPAAREPQRRNSRSNRARILVTARQELGQNPDMTLEEIARAAGVVRRTLFGHFPGRAALVDALAEEASEALRGVAAAAPDVEEAPSRALARFVLSVWPVGDRYRMLLALARQDLGRERVSEILAPARDEATAILQRGQQAGVFHNHVPAAVLSAALESLTLSLLESVNTRAWEDDGTQAAVATLVAAGVSDQVATGIVGHIAAETRSKISAD